MAYLDTSAYVKLPLVEDGHEALRAELGRWDGYVSSTLLAVEAVRACGRYGVQYGELAREWLEGVALLPLDDRTLAAAIELGPSTLRSLDALHLATALSVREDVGAFVVYDERLSRAAVDAGLPVVAPA